VNQQPEPLSPEERGRLREALTRVMGPLRGILRPDPWSEDLLISPATLIELLAENEALAARVSSMEAERGRLIAERNDADEKWQRGVYAAQEVRRAWDAYDKDTGMVLANFEAVGAAIDALVPPVPAAAPHDEANAKSPYPLKVTAWGWANDRPMPECCEFLHLPDTENCRRCGKPLCPAPPENEKEARS
jgi:hypothetical protein